MQIEFFSPFVMTLDTLIEEHVDLFSYFSLKLDSFKSPESDPRHWALLVTLSVPG